MERSEARTLLPGTPLILSKAGREQGLHRYRYTGDPYRGSFVRYGKRTGHIQVKPDGNKRAQTYHVSFWNVDIPAAVRNAVVALAATDATPSHQD
jgi:hypothetical protein